MEYVKLNNGVKMPILGYGAMLPREITTECVKNAIDVGYRLIDTSQGYFNEKEVGDAVRTCGAPRDELFITTKMWVFSEPGYDKGRAAINAMDEGKNLFVDHRSP